MKVEVLAAGRLLQLRFAGDADDPVAVEGGPQLARNLMTAQVPDGYTTERVHPDVLALVALLCTRPWICSRLDLSWAVSTTFSEAVERNLKIVISRVDPDLRPRTAPAESVPALAFSGGIDSMAAAAVMPRGTILYFNERTNPPDARRSLYDMSAAVHTCEGMAKLGHRVRRVQCDVEHLRSPVGCPDALSSAIPALLLADSDGIDALGWGIIAEAAYCTGRHGFREYTSLRIHRAWRTIFASVGIDFLNPVVGVSEVGTSLIVWMAPAGDLAQSCIRGGPGKPCERCWKCVRKGLLNAALSGTWPTERWVASSLAAKEPMRFLTQIPIKHECVLTFALARYLGSHPALVALRRRVRADGLSVDWMLRHYSPALDLVPGRYRAEVRSRLERYLRPMSVTEEAEFRDWSLAEVETSDLYRDLSQDFASEVAKLRARAGLGGFFHNLNRVLEKIFATEGTCHSAGAEEPAMLRASLWSYASTSERVAITSQEETMSSKKSGGNRGYDATYSSGGFGYEANRNKWEDWVQRHYIGEFQLREGERILDIPCGDGFWSSVFAKKGFKVVGIDLNETGIAEARRRFPQIEFHLGNAEQKLPVPADTFDIVFSRAITHLHQKELFRDRTLAMLRNLMAYVRPGGFLLISYYSKRDGSGSEVHAFHPLDALVKVCETAGNTFKVTVVDNYVQIGVERRDARRPWQPLRAQEMRDRQRHSAVLTRALQVWHKIRALQTSILRRRRSTRSGNP